MARGIQDGRFVPRLEGVLDVCQAGLGKLGVVAQDHGLEVGLVDPAHALRGVVVVMEAVGVETIGLQSATSVQDEDLEHGLAEAETGGPMALRKRADQQVELLDVFWLVPVYRLQLFPDIRFIGEVVEALDRIQPELAAELVVTRHATFARARYLPCRCRRMDCPGCSDLEGNAESC